MSLPSFIQRLRGMVTPAQTSADAVPLSASDVEATRVRARRRLIGMVVLVGAGVLGFPWLFETQPRPMSSEIEMVRAGEGDARASEADGAHTPAASGKVALVTPAPVPERVESDAPVTPQPSSEREPVEEILTTPPLKPEAVARVATQRDEPKAVVSKEAPKAAPKESPKEASKDAHKEPPKEATKPAPKEPVKAEVKPADKPADKSADKSAGRYVVQFGAFSDGITAYEARMKVERLGLKTYTQEVKTPQGIRIRVRMGPYADRAEADKALASLRKAGLGGAVLTL